jgi:homogentisate 1,2-dioxygenase
MPIYHKLGKIPQKRHVQYRKQDGSLYYEQLFGTIGFAGMSSLLYQVHRPTRIASFGDPIPFAPKAAVERNMLPRRFLGFRAKPAADYLESRNYSLFNNDLAIALAAPKKSMEDYFYKNADSDELVFVHEGSGTLRTFMGNIDFEPGDYLLIPRGMIHAFRFNSEANRLLITESAQPLYTPKRYRNHFGQLLEHSPFCERDYKLPTELETYDERGEFLIKVKKEGLLHPIVYQTHPFDVIGWDGYNYPWGFSIHNFEPITGRVHQPPPVHQTFENDAFVVCSFCPRLYDYHPDSIPAPYNHSNIDSDEVLYYVDGDFMSRNDVERGMITLHPAGIPHGPQPGATERSIGKKETNELAVMIDTFRPLKLTAEALGMEDPDYYASWQE